MTLLDDPPIGDRQPAASDVGTTSTGRSPVPTWTFAARLARREVRRRPGRTLLVAALVAVPVLAMTVASVLYRTSNEDWASTFERRHGAADLVVQSSDAGPDIAADIAALVPDGTRLVESVSTWTGIVLADGSRPTGVWLQFTDLPLDDPIVAGIVEVRSGRAPSARDEILLDHGTADHLGVGVGDTVELARPSGSWYVAGIGRHADDHQRRLMVVHDFDHDRLRPTTFDRQTHVDLPDSISRADAAAVVEALTVTGEPPTNRWQEPPPSDDTRVLAWGWVVGVLALVAVGIVIASAFATSARRQLVTIGHLSANGASTHLIRRTLALQGSWTSLVGTIAAMALAAGGLLAGRPLVESVVNRSIGAYRVSVLDLIVIAATGVVAATIAAAVPARTAARVPVLSALAGRQPLGAPSPRLVPVGVSLFLGGLGLLFVAATGARSTMGDGDVFALVAVLGGIGVVFGMCCATPLAVAAMGRLGGASGSGTWRLATRSTARVRTRSSGVVTAVATAAAFAVAGVTIAAVWADDTVSSDSMPRNVVAITQWDNWWSPGEGELVDLGPLEPLTFEPAVRDRIDQIVPDAQWVPVRAAGFDPRPFDPEREMTSESGDVVDVRNYSAQAATIADPAVLELVGLSDADERLLAAADLIEIGSGYVSEVSFVDGDPFVDPTTDRSGPILHDVVFPDESGDIRATWALTSGGSTSSPFWTLMAPERAETLGFEIVEVGALLINPTDLTEVQRREISMAAAASETPTVFVEPGDEPIGAGDDPYGAARSGISTHMAWDVGGPSLALVHAIIVALAVLFTLLVVAIGLSLSATESREERNVLVAVGAPPRTLGRVAGAKAFALAGTGVVLAVPTGYLPTWVVYRTVDSSVPFPWLTVGILVLVVPLVAGLAAWASSTVARRVRPVRLSTSFGD